jgi:hypothetical protein
MLFSDALISLKEGHLVTRHAWDESKQYLTLMPEMEYIWVIQRIPNPSAGNWLPLLADLLADDWKIKERV